MPAAVQIRSRANRVKLFKKFLRHSTPNFRCTHNSRLTPRKNMEGMWKHSKFFSSQIKKGVSAKPSKKTSLLDKQLKAEPKKRGKRGILKKTETGKKPVVIKKLKKKKYVQFGKGKAYHKQAAQEAREYEGYSFASGKAHHEAARTFGARGDTPEAVFEREADAAGRRTGQLVRKRTAAGQKMFRQKRARRMRTV